ncbi:hypothetical protein FRC08_005234 [Ceratobasidium sp. 394]|nr:hypothetical protein FRC08_005234 [Ceratobasidium sp. 394]
MAAKFLTTNELVDLLLSNLSDHELATTLTVNQRFFDLGASRLWRNLIQVDSLFGLLLDDEYVRASGFPKRSLDQAELTVSIPDMDQIDPARWSRFNLYAGFVRTLDASWNAFPYTWLGLEKLLDGAPIVPRVHTIDLRIPERLRPDSLSYCVIIKLFLGPRTARLTCQGPRESGLKPEHTASILESALALKSPLEYLDLRTSASGDAPEIGAPSWAGLVLLEDLRLSAPSLGAFPFDQVRNLPSLRNLCVDQLPGGQWRSLGEGSDWEEGAFPSLRVLRIFGASCGDLRRLFLCRPILLTGLTELRIATSDAYSKETAVATVASVIAVIGDSARRLRALVASFTSDSVAILVGLEALAPIFSLELERLELRCLRLTGRADCSALHGLWPSLRHLSIPFQPATPSDLLQFAKRRRLWHINLDVRPPAEDDAAVSSHETLERLGHGMLLSSEYRLSGLPRATLRSYAAFLLRCWPNLSLSWSARRDDHAGADQDGFHDLIRELREVRGLPNGYL